LEKISLSKKAQQILNRGNKWKHQIDIKKTSYNLNFDLVKIPNIGKAKENKVEAIWQEKFKDAKNMGNILFPGPIMSMKSVSKEKKKINLKLFKTNYKYVIAAREINLSPQYDYFIGIRGICQVRVDNQTCIVIGARSPKTTSMKGELEAIPAGILMPDDFKKQKPLKTRLISEFKEELSIEEKIKIENMDLISIKGCKDVVSIDIRFLFKVENDWLNHFEVNKHKNFHKIISLKGSFPEHRAVYIVPLTSLSDFIVSHKDSWAISKDILLDLYEYLKR